jgi:hypothetical protein
VHRQSKFQVLPLVALLFAVLANVPAATAADSNAALEARVATLEAQLAELKAQLAQLQPQVQVQVQAQAQAQASQAATAASPSVATPSIESPAPVSAAPALSWFGYGELNYTRPAAEPAQARADVGRFVLGAGYRFDERTRLVSEIEIEHAISSSSDPGEVEIEQAYIEHDLNASVRAQMGLFLIPSGLINENHEPTRYYGVFRNFIETAIIPSTWREGGVGLQGNSAVGLRWDVGVTTGFDLSKWDAGSVEGTKSPLGSIHQELALAKAKDLSGYLALQYTGINGLRLGGSLFAGGAGQGQPGFAGSRVSLWETHARWLPGSWDLAALYARGHISGTAALNESLAGNPTLIPEDFFGWYVEAAWRARVGKPWPLVPFLRYERFNTASSYAMLNAVTAPQPLADRIALTGGLQWQFAPGVIFKADYVDFAHGREGDRFDLGLGYEF